MSTGTTKRRPAQWTTQSEQSERCSGDELSDSWNDLHMDDARRFTQEGPGHPGPRCLAGTKPDGRMTWQLSRRTPPAGDPAKPAPSPCQSGTEHGRHHSHSPERT